MKIKLYRNPFDLEDSVEYEVDDESLEHKDLKQYFNDFFPEEFWESYYCVVSGGTVTWEYVPQKESEILFVKRLEGGGGGLISSILGGIMMVAGGIMLMTGWGAAFAPYLIVSGAAMLAGGLASMFTDVPVTDMRNSATYSWDGIQNIIGEGHTSLVVYGTHRVGGAVIEGYVDGTNENGTSDKSYLYMVTLVSEGPVQEVLEDSALINGKSVWMYSNEEEPLEGFFNAKTGATETVSGVIVNSRAMIEAEYKASNPYLDEEHGNAGASGNDGESGYARATWRRWL